MFKPGQFIFIRKVLRKILQESGLKLLNWSKRIYLYPEEIKEHQVSRRLIGWVKDKGDNTVRLNYQLDNHSIVFDLGGYEGKWSSEIYSMYNSYIYVFEPVKQFYWYLKKKFMHNKKISVFNFGLSDKTRKIQIGLNENCSSEYDLSNEVTTGKLISIKGFLLKYNIECIDLMKINIEGGEYDLLEYLISAQLIRKIRNLQIQFHDFIPNAEKRMQRIQKQLNITHKLTYQYMFIWENWELKK